MVWSVKRGPRPVDMAFMMEPVVHCTGIHPEGEGASVNEALVVLRLVDDGVKRLTHKADTKRDLGDQIPHRVRSSVWVTLIWATMPSGVQATFRVLSDVKVLIESAVFIVPHIVDDPSDRVDSCFRPILSHHCFL